jgi:hypothetical protein
MGDEHTPALIAAFAVALSARTNTLTAQAVDDMRARAEELLDPKHPARPGIIAFATQYELHRHNRERLAELGCDLEACLHRAVAPAAPERPYRADIDG